VTEREWDKRLHIRTIGREDESDVNYSPYEPTPYSVLERLADSGWIRRKDHLLDYGCGKGRAVFFMAAAVGCRATGVDLSQKLIDIASENRRASRLGDRVSLRCCLAEKYEIAGENVFFFFNPFSEKVFEGVVRRILALERRGGEPLRLICYYPSEAYLQCMADVAGVEPAGVIDCGDLFNGKNPREKLVLFKL